MPKGNSNAASPTPANPRPSSGSNPSTPRTATSSAKEKGNSAIYRSISACNRCRSRKTKCDQLFPACTSCAKAGVECVGVDAATGREIPRSYVSHLEERIAALEAQLKQGQAQQPASQPRQQQQQSNGTDSLVTVGKGSTSGLGEEVETGRKRKSSHQDESSIPMRADQNHYDTYRGSQQHNVTSPPLGSASSSGHGLYDQQSPVSREEGSSRSGAHLRPDIENLVTTVSAVTVQGANQSGFLGSSSGIS